MVEKIEIIREDGKITTKYFVDGRETVSRSGNKDRPDVKMLYNEFFLKRIFDNLKEE
jgi:hypothetical protein